MLHYLYILAVVTCFSEITIKDVALCLFKAGKMKRNSIFIDWVPQTLSVLFTGQASNYLNQFWGRPLYLCNFIAGLIGRTVGVLVGTAW